MPTARRLLRIAAACTVGLLALWLVVAHVGPLPGDRAAVRAARAHPVAATSDAQLNALLAGFGDRGPAVATLVLVALALWRTLPARTIAWVLACAGAGALAGALKHLWGPVALDHALFGGAASFPSGHAAYSSGLLGALALLAWRRGHRPAVVAAALLALGVAWAMVRAGAHTPSDVLGGWLLGAGWVSATLALAGPRTLRR